MGLGLCPSVQDYFADLTDVTLADEDTKSILTDRERVQFIGNKAIASNKMSI